MKKIISVIFIFIGLAIAYSSCSSDSYADKLEKEEKTLKNFIKDEGIREISEFPDNKVFADKVYFKDPDTGIYIHVIDSGSKNKIIKGDEVYMRFYETRLMHTYGDSLLNNDEPNRDEFAAMNMTYGSSSTYTLTSYSSGDLRGYYKYVFLSPACARPLDYNLGYGAEVSLIVPFATGNGSYYQQYIGYEPIFFGRLKYTK